MTSPFILLKMEAQGQMDLQSLRFGVAAFLNALLNITMYIEIPECMEALGFMKSGNQEEYAI